MSKKNIELGIVERAARDFLKVLESDRSKNQDQQAEAAWHAQHSLCARIEGHPARSCRCHRCDITGSQLTVHKDGGAWEERRWTVEVEVGVGVGEIRSEVEADWAWIG